MTMRLALFGASIMLAAYATMTHVTYLNTGGYSADWPEYRRIAVVSPQDCAALLGRAERTLGESHGLRCEGVPRWRHWANLTRAAYDRDGVGGVALAVLGGQAVASAAAAPTAP
ncbi:hypothetical protein GCM10008179_04310 [Hansschlegelia plantiphila]|uniref:Uncharacterized protein n=2 Tax=Hansschlegelia plantiphila TaxID=374655 RepID=A0A9W6MUE0_9HYPH|nr:hypothetical protein GCM10008179_04310 [Hansschlegelia plantiphila]